MIVSFGPFGMGFERRLLFRDMFGRFGVEHVVGNAPEERLRVLTHASIEAQASMGLKAEAAVFLFGAGSEQHPDGVNAERGSKREN